MVAVKSEVAAALVHTTGWPAPLTDFLTDSPTDEMPPRWRLTSRYVEIDGVRTIPISGELHFSRMPRSRWLHRLRQLRAGGVTVVACYIFWNHHATDGPHPSFAGNLDIAAFVDECDRVGLDVILRLGPWCHGEVRNGGLPDWVIEQCSSTRTDDPTYLGHAGDWFTALATELRGRLGRGSRVIGFQLENELYDNPDHIVTLKRLAQGCGLWAPLWTATSWGSADLPTDQVLPLYGGYGDGFWVDADAPWDDTFRAHYFFSHTWDDPGIGADVRALYGPAALPPRPHPDHALVATCELAGGMATAYHRRPWPDHLDVAAIAHAKLGSGSAWQGYYMYAGGANPPSRIGLQESHATGYPNDLERIGYDFHAPIGAAGTLRLSHAELRLQHAFAAAFGPLLTVSASSLPVDLPVDVHDTGTLRWAWRGTADGGFVFVNWHQPHEPLSPYRNAQFTVDLGDQQITFPHRPVDLPVGTIAHWPVALTVHQVTVRWATASAVTVLPATNHRPPTLVLLAEPGIEPQISVGADVRVSGGVAMDEADPSERAFVGDPTAEPPLRLLSDGHGLDVLVLPAALRHELWVLETADRRQLVRSRDELVVGDAGQIVVRSADLTPRVELFDAHLGEWTEAVLRHDAGQPGRGEAAVVPGPRPELRPPVGYGHHQNRASAPSAADIDRLAQRFDIRLPPTFLAGQEATVEIDWAGDVAVLVVDGEVVADRFWDGSVWELDAVDLGLAGGFEIRIVPLRHDAAVWVPEAAQRRRDESGTDLVQLESVRLRSYGEWTVLS